jgi:hypothetical protein
MYPRSWGACRYANAFPLRQAAGSKSYAVNVQHFALNGLDAHTVSSSVRDMRNDLCYWKYRMMLRRNGLSLCKDCRIRKLLRKLVGRAGVDLRPADEESRRRPTSEDSARAIIGKRRGFMMAYLIMGHGVSGCFGTRLAPMRSLKRGQSRKGTRFETTDVPETIGPDLSVSALTQSFTNIKGR